ncbi:dynamin family protein [uncultured Phocaeicola sp.]|jgi:GTPase Era involved in 16S rRNA processing|uniref:dynamin family protein n=1 Tax=uncultured Phocaeicola sp. TaxID=990718 RepID=UPI00258B54EE|nr:dynamin family protein [uncultured Phocaeicola sp.]
MKTIKIKYNPYLLETTIQVDGKAPKSNSKLNFGKLRIQEWSARLAQILLDECSDRNFCIEFTGTQSDFEDLKEALTASKSFQWTFVPTHIQDSVSDVEKKVDEIFKAIQNGPVEQLRDKTIREAFQKAKNSEFEVNVVATMSSGKSTLINAILGKKLMPVANMATTATIVKIINTEQDDFSAKAYDANGKLIKEDPNITYRTMKEWNKDTSISSIDIHGRIPCVESVGMRLVLVDTPGPNNSRDENHRRMTYDMLADSDKSLVLFVMNATQLNVDDQKNLMDFVCECMEKGGKQSRERYIFAINKMDSFNPEDDNPSEALDTAKDVLLDNKITSPNLFPVSAQAALECRTDVSQSVLPIFIPRLEEYSEMKFDAYYQYNNLPLSVRHDIEEILQNLKPEDRVEVHSGIVSIEQAIGLYINKYARAIKVKDLVDSFNDRLNELKAVASLQSEIRQNKDRKVQLDKQIEEIKTKIESGKSAQTLSKLIDRKDLSGNVTEEIDEYINATKTKIDKIIFRHSKSTKVRKSEAIRQVEAVEKESYEILNQLDSRVGRILEKAYKNLMSDIIMEYQNYLEALGLSSAKNELGLHPLDFVAEELADVNRIISNNVTTVDEGHDETRQRQVRGEKKTNWFWTPWNWGTDRYETKTESYSVHIANNVDYVDMSSVVKEYMKPLQQQLIDAKQAVTNHAQSESVRIKKSLKDYLNKIDTLLQRKLEELKKSTNSAAQTQKEIEHQESNLKWMESIIKRVNELINF